MGHQRNRAGQHPPSLTVIGIALVAVLLTAVIGPSGAQAQSAAAADAHLVVGRGGADDVMVPDGFSAVGATAGAAGLWMTDASGRVEASAGAQHRGDVSTFELRRPVVAMAATPTGNGYWLVASDGGVFAFGDAPFLGSTGASPSPSPVVDAAPGPDGGYWLARSDGSVVGFGAEVPDSTVPAGRTVAMAVRPAGGLWLIGTPIPELAGGGTEVFGDDRMIVAHYGSPASPVLGVLGELPPDAALQAVVDRSSLYGTVGVDVIPAVEIIVTVAHRSPGPDGDYSGFVDLVAVEDLVDAAERAGALVVLDLQPGRSTFLSQAVVLEDLLRRPHVGLALDPEWRMGPGQVPARVVGSVTAAEVNEVSAWLADLVAREGLPEKLFVIHQFTDAMVQNRTDIVTRTGLAITFHADGFGGRSVKLGSYSRYSAEAPFYSGFKLFLDEDTNLFSPQEVLELVPRPDLVTYQ